MKLAEIYERVAGPDARLAFEAYDGSSVGAADATCRVRINNPRAIRHIVRAPGELGVARAFVSGDIDFEGDIVEGLSLAQGLADADAGWRDLLDVVKAAKFGMIGPAPIPDEEVRIPKKLSLHSKSRDAEMISHHYDVSNRFYEMVLGPTMAYTCAVFPTADATLEEAQEEKFDLVCRKLDLQAGQRLLDVGCGWGGMVRHAAKHYGVQALGVTLSKEQAEWAQKAIADDGLSDVAEVRHCDYRDVPEGQFDRISSIGLTEHIGWGQLDNYFTFLHTKLRDEGRLLNHAIMRPQAPLAAEDHRIDPGGFMYRYVFPDGELEEVGEIITAMHRNGFEVHHEENLRPHYAKTLHQWCRNLDDNWDACVSEVGEPRARVWALYMAASEWMFLTGRMHLHQVLGTKSVDGFSGMPLRWDFSRKR